MDDGPWTSDRNASEAHPPSVAVAAGSPMRQGPYSVGSRTSRQAGAWPKLKHKREHKLNPHESR